MIPFLTDVPFFQIFNNLLDAMSGKEVAKLINNNSVSIFQKKGLPDKPHKTY